MDSSEFIKLLSETATFAILSSDERCELAERFQLVHYSLGQTIVRSGEVANSFYVVYSGRARVIAINSAGEDVTVGSIERGGSFGEQGILSGSVRRFTVRAATDVALLRLDRVDFELLLDQHPELREYFRKYISELSIRNFLKLCTALAPLSANEIRDLLGSLEIQEFKADHTIIREGDRGDAFYIMRTGSAQVMHESNGRKNLNVVKAGDSFGELALLRDAPRVASVITTEPSSVFRLAKAEFDRIVSSSSKFRSAVQSVASSHEPPPRLAEIAAAQELTPAPFEQTEAKYKPQRARAYPELLQVSETDCGAACLAMILRYYGKRVSINRLREVTGVSREGASLYNVSLAAETLGFEARIVKSSYEYVLNERLPAIAHWEGFHYVVVYSVSPNRVVVADPSIGLRKLSREKFQKGWNGYLLLLTPTPEIESVEESKSTYSRFLPLLRPYRWALLKIFLASLLLQLLALAVPLFTQVIVDSVLVSKSTSLLNMLLVGMLLVAIVQTAITAIRYYLLVHTTRRIDMQMMVNFYRHVLSLPMRFFEERKVGDILKRLNENARIRELLTGRAVSISIDGLMVFVFLGLVFYYSVKLTLLALLFIPGYIILTLVATPIFKRQYREAFTKSAEADSQMVESVAGIGTVKASAAESSVRQKLENLSMQSLNVQFRTAISGMATLGTANLLQMLNTIFLLWYGARLVINGDLSVGQLVAFNVLVGYVTNPILNLVDLWREIQEINVSFERLNDVFDAKPEEDQSSQSLIELPPIQGHIKFDNVTFRYPTRPDTNALQNVNLEIMPGQTVALVGRSGAGKTTFANMLLRLHEPNEGRILIDGYDLRRVSIGSLRSQIGVVPQDVFLFSGTIRENIAFGDSIATLDSVVNAAMIAGAHEFISELPLGYETVIGERGQTLSGGQKQRIALARALFKNRRILVFDEATSALDTESERAIQQNLNEILKDRTTMIIAHRLSTVRNSDVIVVMDRGVIREVGNHHSLMEQKGLYYFLCTQQIAT